MNGADTDDLPDEKRKPLGAYRCGGRCDEDGYIGGSYDGVPCSKCRVYMVATGDSPIYNQRVAGRVRARKALDAIQLYAAGRSGRFSAYRLNVEHGKRAATLRYDFDPAKGWKRVLSKWSQERAENELHWRIANNMRLATDSWKVPEGIVAGIVKAQLDKYMKARSLVFKK
ncbi:MAG: hypothetical protein JO277_09720 [Candidatus Eremiobacteraeota bacterium]|nr:hypothetical protein [Candidatus Eremiobacteraeota bacterium]MBV8722417.1 hypothetical protein [Candidatus Eremiobacteraeota bacterium]